MQRLYRSYHHAIGRSAERVTAPQTNAQSSTQAQSQSRTQTAYLLACLLSCFAMSLVISLFATTESSFANADGRRFTRNATTTAGCSGNACHGTSTPNTGVRLWAFANNQRIVDSLTIAPGMRVRFTVMVAHSNAAAGVNIAVRTNATTDVAAGTITPADNTLSLRGTAGAEVTQARRIAKAMPTDSAVAFSFDWVAPTTPGTYFLRAVGNAVNGNVLADAADVWNWLQPVRLVVTLASSVRLQPAADGENLSIAPNPASGATTFAWTLPDGSAAALNEEFTLRLVNAAGTEFRSWNGTANAGQVTIPFDGKDAQGVMLPTGQYFAVLQTRRRQLVRTVALIR
jgi:hypothetical protein